MPVHSFPGNGFPIMAAPFANDLSQHYQIVAQEHDLVTKKKGKTPEIKLDWQPARLREKKLLQLIISPQFEKAKKDWPHGKESYFYQLIYEALTVEFPSMRYGALLIADCGGLRVAGKVRELKKLWRESRIPSGGQQDEKGKKAKDKIAKKEIEAELNAVCAGDSGCVQG